MADGDIYDQHGRKWWMTTARKLFTQDRTFEASMIRSIDKMFGNGNFFGFSKIVDALAEALNLDKAGITSQVLLEYSLQELAASHVDLDTMAGVAIAREMFVDFSTKLRNSRLDSMEMRIQLGQELLARTAIAIASTPDLVHGLNCGQNNIRLSASQVYSRQDEAKQLLSQSEYIRQRVCQKLDMRLTDSTPSFKPTRPRSTVDQRSLLNQAIGD